MLLAAQDGCFMPLVLLNYLYTLPNRLFAISVSELYMDYLVLRQETQHIIKLTEVILVTFFKFIVCLSFRTKEYRHFALELGQVTEVSVTYRLILVFNVIHFTYSLECIIMA